MASWHWFVIFCSCPTRSYLNRTLSPWQLNRVKMVTDHLITSSNPGCLSVGSWHWLIIFCPCQTRSYLNTPLSHHDNFTEWRWWQTIWLRPQIQVCKVLLVGIGWSFSTLVKHDLILTHHFLTKTTSPSEDVDWPSDYVLKSRFV